MGVTPVSLSLQRAFLKTSTCVLGSQRCPPPALCPSQPPRGPRAAPHQGSPRPRASPKRQGALPSQGAGREASPGAYAGLGPQHRCTARLTGTWPPTARLRSPSDTRTSKVPSPGDRQRVVAVLSSLHGWAMDLSSRLAAQPRVPPSPPPSFPLVNKHMEVYGLV